MSGSRQEGDRVELSRLIVSLLVASLVDGKEGQSKVMHKVRITGLRSKTDRGGCESKVRFGLPTVTVF